MSDVHITINVTIGSDGKVSLNGKPLTTTEEPCTYDTPGSAYDIGSPTEAAFTPKTVTPAEPQDAHADLLKCTAWVTPESNEPLACGDQLLSFYPGAAKLLGQADSVEAMEKIFVDTNTSCGSDAASLIRNNPDWSLKLLCRLRVGLGLPEPKVSPKVVVAEVMPPEPENLS